jgi:hypothetical protein
LIRAGNRLLLATVALATVALAAGCYSPSIANGELQCAVNSKQCPAGFHCASDNTCWKNGQDPGAGIDGGSDDMPPTGTNLGNGDPCADASQCTSGFCAPEGVCCDTACTGACQACNLPGSPGTCSSVPAGMMPVTGHDTCGPDAQSTCMRDGACDGAGACHLWNDVICKPGSCDATTNKAVAASKCDGLGTCVTPNAITCDPFVCLPDNTACYPTCSGASTGCKPPNSCNAGSCGPKANGSPCTAGTQCQSAKCSPDGYCCDQACTGKCEACDIAPNVGTCTALVAGQPHAGHGGNCAGTGTTCGGACAAGNRATCTFPSGGTTCSAQTCANSTTQQNAAGCNSAGACSAPTTTGCGSYLCSGTACLTSCNADGNCAPGTPYCNNPTCLATKPLGSVCGGAGECTSTFCNDSRCCNVDCSGQCTRCDATPGTCTNTGNGVPPVNGRAACGSSVGCYGSCNGGGACGNFPNGTACTRPDNVADVCNGSGHCGSGCFVAGTMVDTADGPRAIESIEPGTMVRAFDVQTGQEGMRKVTELQHRRSRALVEIGFVDGTSLTVTPEHYFWVEGPGWVRAIELTVADRLRTPSGDLIGIAALVSTFRGDGAEETEVYNLIVDGENTYFVGAVPVLVESCDFTNFSSLTFDEIPH